MLVFKMVTLCGNLAAAALPLHAVRIGVQKSAPVISVTVDQYKTV